MTSPILWSLIAIQIAMGGFDTFYHHEFRERLAWRPAQHRELRLHAIRNFLYALLFATLGWTEVHGIWAWLVAGALVVELVITLMDFVEEDATRKLPSSERVNHTLLALNYGAILALLAPVLLDWGLCPSAIAPAYHGLWSIMMTLAAVGTGIGGARDLAASLRMKKDTPAPAADLARALTGRRTVLITGATGFIGTRLIEALSAAGHAVIVLVRQPAKAQAFPPPYTLITSLDQIAADTDIDAIVNLAGEPIADGLWTRAKRARIVESRVAMTADVVRLMTRMKRRPAVLVNGSAIGWYGLQGDEPLLESSSGNACFSRKICEAWEEEAKRASPLGVRVVLLRIGLVLGTEGGMLARLLLPFEYGIGGPIGTGKQWMSWIARDDLVRLIAHAIATPELRGPVNATAPEPVRNATFARELGRALHRPALLPLPAFPLHLALGDFADELLLGGQRVLPHKAMASGFVFRHETLDSALSTIIGGTTQTDIPSPHRSAA
jgi:hypothetical protein